jgi:hypothetical protein
MANTFGSNPLSVLWNKLRALFSPRQEAIPIVIQRKVMAIVFYPPAALAEATRAGWKNPDDLINQYIEAMGKASKNMLAYQVVNKVQVNYFPLAADGRQYDDTTWVLARKDDKTAFRDAAGNYVIADYRRLIQDFKMIQVVQNQLVDEIWMFGGPYFGFYESCMVGRGAFNCNGVPIQQDSRRFVIMGFNYERDVKEMVHDYGHRAERILAKKFGSDVFLSQLYDTQTAPAPRNAFEQFLLDRGTVHRTPGGKDYGQDEFAWLTAFQPEWWPPTIDPNRVKTI